MMGFFSIMSAIPGFFFCSFLLMLFWGIISPDLGIVTVSYPMSMLITLALWLVIAPMAKAAGSVKKK